jgi:hypothetical protein
MRFFSLTIAIACALLSLGATTASAQTIMTYALKSGESVEISSLYYVSNCQSVVIAPIEVTMLDGPPGVTAAAQQAMVVPRNQQCARPVQGAKLIVTAGQIEDASRTLATLRIRYKTKDGVRDLSQSFYLQLFP